MTAAKSSAGSPASAAAARVGRTIGLAYVPEPAAGIGSALQIKGEGGEIIAARVAATPFFDPEGVRSRS